MDPPENFIIEAINFRKENLELNYYCKSQDRLCQIKSHLPCLLYEYRYLKADHLYLRRRLIVDWDHSERNYRTNIRTQVCGLYVLNSNWLAFHVKRISRIEPWTLLCGINLNFVITFTYTLL
jgi:hypothetical protein